MAEDIRTMHEEDEDEVKYCERKRLLFFGLPWTFTKYTITPSMLTIDEGLLKTEENDCYMYKVQDVKLTTTLLELKLIHIKKSKEVKNYLLKASEAARMKRRTLNTLDIGAEQDLSDALDS